MRMMLLAAALGAAGLAQATELNNDSLPGSAKVFVLAKTEAEARGIAEFIAGTLGEKVDPQVAVLSEPAAAVVVLEMAETDAATKAVGDGAGHSEDAAVADRMRRLSEKGVLVVKVVLD